MSAPSRDLFAGDRQLALLRGTVCVFGSLLLGFTWRLWLPQSSFPQVPWFAWAANIPPWCQWAASIGMAVGLIAGLLVARRVRLSSQALCCFSGALLFSILCDQHRLQPWAYQLGLVAAVLAIGSRQPAFRWLRLLTISIYFYSAISKVDYSFLHSTGPRFVVTLAEALGGSTDLWPPKPLLAASWLFPLVELLMALGLGFASSRRVALMAAVGMHLLLLVIFGPWGLNNEPAVLLWNLYFIAQDLLLFGRRRTLMDAAAPPELAEGAPPPAASWFVPLLIGPALLLPALSWIGYFDEWPAWSVYSPRSERVLIWIGTAKSELLPGELQPYLEPAPPGETWQRLRIDRWSLDSLGVPLYPQARFQMGVAEYLALTYRLQNQIRAERIGLANRRAGQREREVLTGLLEIRAACEQYLLNAHPK